MKDKSKYTHYSHGCKSKVLFNTKGLPFRFVMGALDYDLGLNIMAAIGYMVDPYQHEVFSQHVSKIQKLLRDCNAFIHNRKDLQITSMTYIGQSIVWGKSTHTITFDIKER